MSVGAVLWDLDGTLIDSEPIHIAALADVLVQAGVPPPPDLHDWLIGLGEGEVHQLLVERLGLALSREALLLRKHAAYRRRRGDLRPRGGSLELFHTLRARRMGQAIVSNSDRVLVELNLSAIGLTAPDILSVSRDDVRCGKPDPEPYLRAASLLGTPPGDCVVVEDSAVGAAAGCAAGMRVVLWPQAEQPCPADLAPHVERVATARALATLLLNITRAPAA